MSGRRRRGTVVAVVALWASALLVGCHGDVSRGASAAEPTASPSHATERATGLKGPVSLTVSGGYAGVNRGIEVASGGEVHVFDRKKRGTAHPLTDADMADLTEALAEVDFAEVPGSVINHQAADLLRYRLTYMGHTVLTDRSRKLGAVDEVISKLAHYLDERTGP